MRGKVLSDGGPVGTRVLTHDGREIRDVAGVTWRHEEAGELPVLDVRIGLHGIEAEGEMRVLARHPVDGGLREVERVAFADGTCWPEPAATVVSASTRMAQIKVKLVPVVRFRTRLAIKILAFAAFVAGCDIDVSVGERAKQG